MADTATETTSQTSGFKEGARYQFRYALFSVLVELQGAQLLVKTSTKTQIIPRASMRSFYAPIIRGESYRELIICYAYRGGLKRARLFSNLGQAQFERLLSDLSAELPHGDLSSLPTHEAYERLGIRELSWVAVPSLMLIATALVALLASPYFLHGLEGEATAINLSALERSEEGHTSLDSYHISLEGSLELDFMVEAGQRARGYELFAPLYSQGSEARSARRPVVIAQLSGTGDLPLEVLRERVHFQGIRRAILWEGLSVKQRRDLVARGVDLSAEPFVLAVDATPSDDLTLYVTLLTMLLSITGAVWWSLKPSAPRLSLSLRDQRP